MTTRSDIDKINAPSGLNVTDKFMMTPEGGFAILLQNRTNLVSVKGTIVRASDGFDLGVSGTPTDSDEPIGVIYNSGVPEGSMVWVVISGIAEVLLKDGTFSTQGNWVYCSDVIGRADASNADPLGVPQHWREIGHCLESKGAGTDVLAKVVLHFN